MTISCDASALVQVDRGAREHRCSRVQDGLVDNCGKRITILPNTMHRCFVAMVAAVSEAAAAAETVGPA